MTVHFERTSCIHAPTDRVFDLALSVDAHLRSMANHKEHAVGGVTTGRIEFGEEVTWHARHFGIRWAMTSRIVALERPARFVDEQTRGPFARFRHEHLFAREEGGTRMIDVVSFDAPFGPVGIIAEMVLAPYVRKLIDQRNLYLKEAAERTSG